VSIILEEGDGCQVGHEDLHATQTKNEVESQLLLDVVI